MAVLKRVFHDPVEAGPEFAEGSGFRLAAFSAVAPGIAKNNEDCAGWIQLAPDHAVFLVADGLGGLPAGAAASALAVETIIEALSTREASDDARAAIFAGIDRANDRIMNSGQGGATTLVLVELRGRSIRPYLIGDSMILVTGQRGRRRYLTVPHSPTGSLMDAGLIDERDAMRHAERFLVSNVLGSPDMHTEVGPRIELNPRDTVVLASDGLSDNLLPDEIIQTVRVGSLEHALATVAGDCLGVMQQGNDHTAGHADDLTILLLRLS